MTTPVPPEPSGPNLPEQSAAQHTSSAADGKPADGASAPRPATYPAPWQSVFSPAVIPPPPNLPQPRELRGSDFGSRPPRPRKVLAPLLLFLATCLSTFYVGATEWNPGGFLDNADAELARVMGNWQNGALYMGALLGILLTHEMGHFLATLRYKIPASFPIFIPVPIHPVGTLGAVISMDGLRANRREIFDIGIAGPLAGLAVAIPVFWIGIGQLDLNGPPAGPAFHNPLIGRLMMAAQHPEWTNATIGFSQLNPFFMAGWVGMLITGLNMLPISQLDGGHVVHALFTDRSKVVGRTFLMTAIALIVMYEAYHWTLMLVLVILIGADHPPTSDDTVPLGPIRWILGIASLAIPIFCFAPLGIEM